MIFPSEIYIETEHENYNSLLSVNYIHLYTRQLYLLQRLIEFKPWIENLKKFTSGSGLHILVSAGYNTIRAGFSFHHLTRKSFQCELLNLIQNSTGIRTALYQVKLYLYIMSIYRSNLENKLLNKIKRLKKICKNSCLLTKMTLYRPLANFISWIIWILKCKHTQSHKF